ncbi:ribose ABC transporter membrane protein [Ferrimonas balearica DSM 9799]|uniref:Ribose ABC transporter membrane protein n=1 Tax=Ferrimonas balearica (strain DSM 9799 / CCM 4581 / KCTC 23876 / PAT) TaxID=550540 RepID=E1SQZ1_FERBD|nr:ribose ABC transporter permease [Ferrimonas balearica]MBY6017409.1 ribose ABC transporter permease [Halomonas denitrificans]ADN76916.1 ribose ABC transporter membrane protein [Ferrimonas balearica DSM 9799]MBW3140094.1 ribose ABC transporter permease [Ferrimonas balearica]MBY5980016.1 ribose ABC transporter permease [Ferrimonas balearica]MBY6093675.1 ribose ABC transporter permease [Ferrimonas balearica]
MTSQAQTLMPKLLDGLKNQKALLALLVLIAVVSTLNDQFFTTGNLMNILRQTSVNAIIAVGMTLVILTAGIDLSVGAVLALCGALGASMVGLELPLAVTLVATLLFGLFLGSLNGLLVAKGKVQAFIATLVTMTAIRGLTMVYTDGRPISTGFTDASDAFAFLGTGYLFGVPMPVWLMLLCFVGAWFLLNHTRLGRYIYAIGGNEAAARLSGIRVDRVKVAVYGISGMMAALAGLIVTSRLSSAQPTAGTAYELDAIAAVVVGGASLAGGRGFIWGTLVGALIIGFLNNALNLLDVSSYYQMIAKAAVILLAVLADRKSHA